MAKKILWLSAFPPLEVQESRLKDKFGKDAQMVHDAKPFKSAEEAAARFARSSYDDWVVVGLSMGSVGRLCELAEQEGFKKPLWTNMKQLLHSQRHEADLRHGSKFFKFLGFRRVKRLAFEFEEGEDF